MAFFVGAGTISDEVVRKETRNGVLAIFRLETGAPNGRKLWIDVEAWGQLAGTIAHHATAGRGVLVSGRLTYKTWRDGNTGEGRHRVVVTALDVDLFGSEADADRFLLPTYMVAAGIVETVYPDHRTKNGSVRSFRLAAGRASSKTGRLWIDIEHWQPAGAEPVDLRPRLALAVSGQLDFRTQESASSREGRVRGVYVHATKMRLQRERSACR